MIERPSFIVTGASASGKSTLIDEARDSGWEYLPTHMSRPKRIGELDGVDGIFIDRERFESNFRQGDYLEPDLDYAELKSVGVYYGTPKLWLDELKSPEKCASPVAIKIARIVFDTIGVQWVHLVCNDLDRATRLRDRGIDEKEVIARMYSGESVKEVPRESRIFDTSNLSPREILVKIRRDK